MNNHKTFKLILSLNLIILAILAMAYFKTGAQLHQYIGYLFIILFIAHNIFNKHWYKALFKGHYNLIRVFDILITILLFICVLTVSLTGFLISQIIFNFNYGPLTRAIHSSSAQWCLVLIGLHLGSHWAVILSSIIKKLGLNKKKLKQIICLRIIILLIIIGGIKAFIIKDIGAKLTMYYSFSFVDNSETTSHFLFNYFLIIAVYTSLSYYIIKFIKQIKNS